jgi:hypothetical protein
MDRRRWIRVLVALTALLAALLIAPAQAGAFAAPVSDTAATGQPCAQVLFVGLRGSGQTNADGHGFGPEIDAVRSGFEANLDSAVSTREVYVDYVSAPVSTIFTDGLNTYLASVHDGEQRLRNVLDDSQSRCTGQHSEQWVVAGYSQGALAANLAVRSYVAQRFTRIVMVADPDRTPTVVGGVRGTATPGTGMYTLLGSTGGPLPQSFVPVQVSVCDTHDVVCDYKQFDLTNGTAIHTGYDEYPRVQMLLSMGSEAAAATGQSILAAHPGPIAEPGSTQIPGTIVAGDSAQLSITGFAPGEGVHVVVYSEPVDLGWINADGNGNLLYSFVIPAGIAVGPHQLMFAAGTGNLKVPFTTASGPPVPGGYVALSPSRILDTRTGIGSAAQQVSAGGTIMLHTASVGGLPDESDIGAVVLNLTVTNATAAGFVTAYPAGQSRPVVSNLNFSAGQTVPNLAVVRTGTGANIALFNASNAPIDLIADVAGYYRSGPPIQPGAFTSLTPSRILDTRSGIGAAQTPVSANGSIDVQIAGREGVAASASSVVLNLTVTQPTASGFITAYPAGQSLPTVSSLNFVSGQTVPNLVVVPLGSGGKITLYNGAGGTSHLIADVAGYFIAGTPLSAGTFVPVAPSRILDSRNGTGTAHAMIPAFGTIDLQVSGRGGVPSGYVAWAVVVNVTVTNAAQPGYITVYPGSQTLPLASNINFSAGLTVPNAVMVTLGPTGTVRLYNASAAPVDLIADIAGYYSG